MKDWIILLSIQKEDDRADETHWNTFKPESKPSLSINLDCVKVREKVREREKERECVKKGLMTHAGV